MNWYIGLKIWGAGVIILSIGLLLFCIIESFADGSPAMLLIGVVLLLVSLFLSLPAIILYSLWLALVKELTISAKAGLSIMLVISTSSVVKFGLWFFTWLAKDDITNDHSFNNIVFWVPLLCCMLAVTLYRKDIIEYLQPTEIISEFSTEQKSIV